MGENVVASLTASIVIDAKDSAVQAMAAIAEAQKELNKHKLEFAVNISDENILKQLQKILNGKDYVINFKDNGIEQITKDIQVLFDAFKKINSGKGIGISNVFVDEKSIQKAMDLFEKVESHLASLKKVVSDVGDGEEFSPLLSTIKDVESAVTGLSNTFSKLKLNINVDAGSGDPKLLAKIEGQKQNVLTAYRNQFAEMQKMRPSNDDVIQSMFGNKNTSDFVKSLQKEILEFSELNFDSIDAKITAYENIIQKMKQLSKEKYGTDIYKNIDPSFGRKVGAAKGALSKSQTKLGQDNVDGLNDLFGKTDLSEVISGLNTICEKLDSIVTSANEIKSAFSGAIKVEGTTAEITDLTNKVKELEAELNKLKSAGVSGSSTGTAENIQKEAEKASKAVNQMDFTPKTEGFDKYTEKLSTAEKEMNSLSLISDQTSIKFETLKNRVETFNALLSDGVIGIGEYRQSLDKYFSDFSEYLNLEKTEQNNNKKARDANDAKMAKEVNDELLSAIKRYEELTIRIAQGKAFEEDLREAKELEQTIERLQNSKYLTEENLNKSNQILNNHFDYKIGDIERQKNQDLKDAEDEAINYNKQLDSALSSTQNKLSSLTVPTNLKGDFDSLVNDINVLNSQLKNCEITLDSYNKKVDSAIKNFGVTQEGSYKNVLTEYARIQTEINKLTTRQVQGEDVSEQIAQQVRKLELLREAAQEAAAGLLSLYDSENKSASYITEWNKIFDLIESAANGSTESIRGLNKAMETLKTDVAGKLDKAESLLNTVKKTPPEGERKESYIKSVSALETAYNNLKTAQNALLNSPGPISAEQRQNIQKYIDELAKAEQALKNLSKSDKGASQISRTKLGNQINEYMHKNSGMSKDFKNQFQALLNEMNFKGAESNVTDLTTRFLNLKVAVRNAGQEGRSFLDVIKDKAWYGLAGQISMYVNLYSAINKVREAITTIVSLDDALVDLKKTTTMSASELNQFYFDSNNVARQMGVTTQEIIEQASAWSRLNKIGLLYGDI